MPALPIVDSALCEYRRRHQRLGNGHLIVYDMFQRVRGASTPELVASVFTLASLTDVLGMPKATLESKYRRCNLASWVVGIPTGRGRPTRGFLLSRVNDVIDIIRTPGARVCSTEHGDTITDTVAMRGRPRKRAALDIPLIPTMYLGREYFTLESVAGHVGMSISAARKALSRDGLLKTRDTLRAPGVGGRPPLGWSRKEVQIVLLALGGADALSEQARAMATSHRVLVGPARTQPAAPETTQSRPHIALDDDVLAQLNALG